MEYCKKCCTSALIATCDAHRGGKRPLFYLRTVKVEKSVHLLAVRSGQSLFHDIYDNIH